MRYFCKYYYYELFYTYFHIFYINIIKEPTPQTKNNHPITTPTPTMKQKPQKASHSPPKKPKPSPQSFTRNEHARVTKQQLRTHIRAANKKSCENTASTLGSRSSMDSKLIRKKVTGLLDNRDKAKDCSKFKQQPQANPQIIDPSSLQLAFQQTPPKHTQKANKQVFGRGVKKNINKLKKQRECVSNLFENDEEFGYEEGMISYREYCMMGNRWIPVLSDTQRDRVMNPRMSQAGSSQIKDRTYQPKIQRNTLKQQPQTNPNPQNNPPPNPQTQQKAVCTSPPTSPPSMTPPAPTPSPSRVDESNRPDLLQILQKLNEQIRNSKSQNVIQRDMRQDQRRYYSQILRGIAQKIYVDEMSSKGNDNNLNTPVKQNLKLTLTENHLPNTLQLQQRINRPCCHSESDKNSRQVSAEPNSQKNRPRCEDISPVKIFESLPSSDCQYQGQDGSSQNSSIRGSKQGQQLSSNLGNISAEDLIKLREMKQLGFVQASLPLHDNKQNTQPNPPPIPYSQLQSSQTPTYPPIQTSLPALLNYLHNLAQTLKTANQTSQLIQSLKLAWGWPKLDKLGRLRRRQYLGSQHNALPDYIFQFAEDYYGNDCLYQFVHHRCLFDVINTQFNRLRPFYQSNGQTFPWNFKLSSPLTFFQIEQHTISLAFEQIKSKLLQNSSYLCGLIVQELPATNPQLLKRRQQRQDFMWRKQLQNQECRRKEENQMENYCTLLLLAVSDEIFGVLLGEVEGVFG